MIRLERVSKRYPGSGDVLSDLSLQIESGEMISLLGASGAGKSTLLRLLGAIERPSAGRVEVFGQDTGRLRAAELAMVRQRIGLIFEDYKLLNDRSALDNVLVPLEIGGYAHQEALRRARAALDKVGLGRREKALPVALSGGEQQRLCIARAVVSRPALILADEPTGNLDPEQAAGIADMLRAFHAVGTTIVVATHDPVFRKRLAGRVLRIGSGQAVEDAAGADA